MACSIKTKYFMCTLQMFLTKLFKYEPGIFDLVLKLVLQQMVQDYMIITIDFDFEQLLDFEQLQLRVNKYFKYFWEGTNVLDIILHFIEFEIKQNRIKYNNSKGGLIKFYKRMNITQHPYNNYIYRKNIIRQLDIQSDIQSYIQKDYYYSWDFSNINNVPKRINNKLKYQRDRNTRHQNKYTKILSSKYHTNNRR